MNLIRRTFPYREYNIIFILIGINIFIFLGERFFGPSILRNFSMRPIDVANGRIWQLVTYMFVHDSRNITHLLFNMLGLFVFGTRVERSMGSLEFLLYYFVTGTLAGFFSFLVYWFTGNHIVYLMGASGALFAVQLAYAAMFPQSIIYIWGILPLRAPVMVLGYTAIEVILMLTGMNRGVAHITHLAGFVFGWAYFLVRFGINPWKAMRRY
ncbi:MAG: rhomboid family intramembrane serine protease [Treponema sp.]|jgi:membrane associated rhomboid family serine protease|nr:rhomboid family intramembrane serine protease [Treponema sp.]